MWAAKPSCARRRSRRGAALVETAIVLPLMMTLALGCVDFGRFVFTLIAVTNAAYVGAEYGIRTPVNTSSPQAVSAWQGQVSQSATAEMGDSFTPASATVTSSIAPDSTAPGTVWVFVQVSYPFATVVDWPVLPNQLTLTRNVLMRALQ